MKFATKNVLRSSLLAVLATCSVAASAASGSFSVIADGKNLGTFSYQEGVDNKFLFVSFVDNANEEVNASSLSFTFLNNGNNAPSPYTLTLDAPTFSTSAPTRVGGSGATFGAFSSATIASPVPEPETYALMLAGLGLVGWAARRRKAAPVAKLQAQPA